MKKLLLLVIVLGIVAAGVGYFSLATPYAGYQREAFITIPARHTCTREIAQCSHSSGVIKSEWQFLLARVHRSPNESSGW